MKERLMRVFLMLLCLQTYKANPVTHQNPYFYDLDRVQMSANTEYYGEDGNVYEGVINFEIYKVKEYDNGELYHLKINPLENGESYLNDYRLNMHLYVTDDKIYRLWSYEYQGDDAVVFYDDDETSVKVWDTEEKIIENGVVVCQMEDTCDDLEDGEYGMHYSIKKVGNQIQYSRYNVKANGGIDFYEWFTWEEGKGLVDYGSGYREEAEILYLSDIQVGRREESSRMKTLFITRYIYNDKSEERDISIQYPHFYGIADAEKEERINALILDDVKKVVLEDNENLNTPFCAYLDYDVKFVNENIISICYQGMCGYSMPGQGLSHFVITTNIDIENEKLLTLNDIVVDFDVLANSLLENQFESITEWDGMSGKGRISREYAGCEGQLVENMKATSYDYSNHYVEWYLMNGQFVFVSLFGVDYEEYAIDIDIIRNVFSEDFLLKVKDN